MGSVIGELVPLAVGVAISPIPIIGVIAMMLGQHARTTSVGFVLGWLVGIVAATTIFLVVGGALDERSSSSGWVKLVLGVILLLYGFRTWRSRDAESAQPRWMSAIDKMRAPAATGLGVALAAVNPKNLVLCASAGVTIGSASLAWGADAALVAIFTVLAATTVVVPVVAYQFAADHLRDPMDRLKVWLEANNATVMGVLILVMGAVLIGKGISGLG
ncbi:GAP family protein [Gordonia aquimaris]|uniref:GAP family protein n=1 Tax=Gordonia aquimaris TaxID=2984863 RepID=A0A9X3D8C0_9ACTN|nr:GAP family protein [Gordonia aquimaris]MCX2965839.1 GAP family protein [Gordonia aquimaris]